MRAEGAFLVSAVRRGGRTEFVRIESLAGEPCRLVTDMPNPMGDGVAVRQLADGQYQLDLRKGQAVVLTPDGADAELVITPVAAEAERLNFWGLN
jgi:hypothetical protein